MGSGLKWVDHGHAHTHPAAHPPLGVFWGLHVPLRGNCGRCSLGLLGEELWLRGVWGRSWVGARQGGGRPPVGGGLAGHLDGWASVPDSPGLRGAWSRLAQDRLLGLKLGCHVDWGAACDSAAGLLSNLAFCTVLRLAPLCPQNPCPSVLGEQVGWRLMAAGPLPWVSRGPAWTEEAAGAVLSGAWGGVVSGGAWRPCSCPPGPCSPLAAITAA